MIRIGQRKTQKHNEKILLIVFLVSFITACTPTQPTPITDGTALQATAIAAAWTEAAFTQTAQPSATPKLAVSPISPTATPAPPSVPPMITPDAVQVERWREYEEALAKSILPFLSPEEVLCEWDILGNTDREVYYGRFAEGKKVGGVLPLLFILSRLGQS